MKRPNFKLNPLRTALSAVTAFAALACQAQNGPASPSTSSELRLMPALVQSSQSGASALGLDYAWTYLRRLESGQVSLRDLPSLDGVFLHAAVLALDARGSLSSAPSDLVRPLQSFDATAAYELRSKPIYARVGLTGRLETTQDLDKRQSQFGLSGLLAKSNALTLGDTVSVLTLYGTVQPDKDEERKTLLGQLSRYERWTLEATYSMPLMRASEAKDDPIWRKPRSLELGYRHWQEVDAPYALRSAGLDRQRLGYLRLNLDGDYFIQFSKGRQPFDQKSQRAIKLGWELKLSHSTHPGAHELEASPPFANS